METTFSKITVDAIVPSLKDGLMQAQLRQTVTRSLPKAKISNSLSDNIYSTTDLGIDSNDYNEVRVSWMQVAKDATVESVQADLDKFPKAKLRRYLASQPILSDDQINVFKTGLTGDALESFNAKYSIAAGTPWGEEHTKFFMNSIVDRQVVRYGEGNTEGKPENEVVLFNGKQQFRVIGLSVAGADDVDLRVKTEIRDIEDIALAPTAKAEQAVTA